MKRNDNSGADGEQTEGVNATAELFSTGRSLRSLRSEMWARQTLGNY